MALFTHEGAEAGDLLGSLKVLTALLRTQGPDYPSRVLPINPFYLDLVSESTCLSILQSRGRVFIHSCDGYGAKLW